jgi:tetratricopeptide (TPR) repeat protein
MNLWYAGSLAMFVLAMLSKGSVAVVPLILLGVVRWLRPLSRADFARLAPFFLVSAVLVPVNVWFQSRLETEIPATGLAERPLTAAAVVWFYLFKALLPIDLAFVYPRWQVNAARLEWWLPLLAAIAVTALLWRHRRSWGWPVLFAWAYFCVSLAPVLGFTNVGFMEHSLVADHYQHLALIGVVALLAAGWSTWQSQARGGVRWLANGVAVIAAATLTLLTWQQSSLYADGVTLFRDTLRENPDSWMAHNNLAALLTEAGRHDEAIGHLRHALRLNPNYPNAHNNLGNALRRSGRVQDAIQHYQRAVELKPAFPTAHYNLAIALSETGELAEAIASYRQALLLQPTYTQAHLNLGNALADSGQLDQAIAQYEAVLQLDPDFVEARFNLGVVLAQLGRRAEAIVQYEKALRLKPDSPEVHYNLGLALLSDHPERAVAHFRYALRLKPDFAMAHNDLGVALVDAGQLSEAIGHFQQALRFQPDLADAQYNLEIARSMERSATKVSQTPADPPSKP